MSPENICWTYGLNYFSCVWKISRFLTYREYEEYKSKYFLVKLQKEVAPTSYNLFVQWAVDVPRYLTKPSYDMTASR